MSASWGINVGATVLVSQLWGAERKGDAARAAYQALLLAVAAAAVITAFGLGFGDTVASLLGASGDVQEMLADYTKIIFSFIFFTIAINVLSGIMQGTGDTKTPLYATLIVNILHVVVAYPLVYGYLGFPKLGVKGAAIAIAISESMGGAFLFIRSLRRRYIIISKSLEMKYTSMIFKLGYPVFIDRLLQNFGSLVFAKVILLYGTAVYAAHQVGLAIEAFSFMPGYGIAVAAATIVGPEPRGRETRPCAHLCIRSKPSGCYRDGGHGTRVLFLSLCPAACIHEGPGSHTIRYSVYENSRLCPGPPCNNHGPGRVASRSRGHRVHHVRDHRRYVAGPLAGRGPVCCGFQKRDPSRLVGHGHRLGRPHVAVAVEIQEGELGKTGNMKLGNIIWLLKKYGNHQPELPFLYELHSI